MLADKQFIHMLWEKYYKPQIEAEKAQQEKLVEEIVVEELVDENGRGRCVRCKHKRKLGKRGAAKGMCKKCRKAMSQEVEHASV